MISDASVTEFASTLRSLNTLDECATLVREIGLPLGFDIFACGTVDLENRARSVFYLIYWPEKWRRFYLSAGLLNNDPIVTALGRWRIPFSWSDLRADRKFAAVGREGLERIAAEGWHDGLVVPIRLGSERVGIVSLSGQKPVISPTTKAHLSAISMLLYWHLRTVSIRQGFAVPPAGLTAREIDCMKLVAKGLSDRQIAAKLGIAATTAHGFVEKAKQRLDAQSRAELVAIAVDLGIIAP